MAVRLNLLVLLLLVSGCVPFRKNGTTHFLVLGIGVVSVNNTNQSVSQVTKSTVLGARVSGHGVAVGYVDEACVAIKTNENVVVEIKQLPFHSLSVCVPHY